MSPRAPLGHVVAAPEEEELYVGYLPRAPRRLGRWVSAIVVGLLALSAGLAVLIARGQRPFAEAVFEYGETHRFYGVIEERPYPVLRLTRLPEPGTPAEQRLLLVAPGKRGAAELVAGLDGRSVELSGTRITRDGELMIELVPGSVRVRNETISPPAELVSLGRQTLAGEIVDSKCYLGVMKPGEGKPHRDCAVRCISGGAPPLLIVREHGEVQRILLSDEQDRPLGRELLAYVAEPVLVTGELLRDGASLRLRVAPGGVRRR